MNLLMLDSKHAGHKIACQNSNSSSIFYFFLIKDKFESTNDGELLSIEIIQPDQQNHHKTLLRPLPLSIVAQTTSSTTTNSLK